ncbi:MAG: hypothetical protein MUC36_15890 [Planctomycetes bacterium]|nr:hypothetical protein [Planctomycetota bacterium]
MPRLHLPHHPVRSTIRCFPPVLLALLAPFPLPAQLDPAALQKKQEGPAAAVAEALQQCEAAVATLRQVLGDPNHKLHGSCDEIANVLKGGSFDAGLGVIPIALEHVRDYVAEERQADTRAALVELQSRLQRGSRALHQLEALQELGQRVQYLAELDAEADATSLLADLASSANRAGRTDALARAELAQLQQQLARRRTANEARQAATSLAQADTELAQLQQDWPSMRTAMSGSDSEERDRSLARFDEAARSIRTALARVPAAGRQPLQQRLAMMQSEADAHYRRAFAAATVERIRNSWEFTADEFAGWAEETAEITATGYLGFDPPSADKLGLPRTVALLQRTNLWFAFVEQDADYLRNRAEPAVQAYTQSIRELRQAAWQKLLPLARAVVSGLASVEILDDQVRGRLQTLADWDLPLALQNHPEQAALVARVHALLDAHDRRTLGDEAAVARIREQAMTAADSLWSRYQQWLPVQAGFEPTQGQLFTGMLMRLDGVWPRTTEFECAPGQLVFDLGGVVFRGTLEPAVAAAVSAARTRLGLAPTDGLDRDQPCELLAVIGDELDCKLLGPKGAEDAMVVPARAVRILGLRQGAVFAVSP